VTYEPIDTAAAPGPFGAAVSIGSYVTVPPDGSSKGATPRPVFAGAERMVSGRGERTVTVAKRN
jgi:hypothetical protein